MSLNTAAKILLSAGSIILMGCAGMQYYKLSLNYKKIKKLRTLFPL